MSKHDKPKPPVQPVINVTDAALNISIGNGAGADVTLITDSSGSFKGVEVSPGRFSIHITAGANTGSDILIIKDGYNSVRHRLMHPDGSPFVLPTSGSWELYGEVLKSIMPPDYDRIKALGMNTHFMGGLIVNSPKYGLMPWWDSCLSWCDLATREEAYRVKKLAGDTHCILEVPNGLPLYDEGNQFYSPDKFGPLDWTNGETSLDENFTNLLKEILQHDFAFHIAMDERKVNSTKIIKLVAQALKDLNCTKDGFVMPGYDGVFYGWDPADIVSWGAIARSINPDILLGLEFTHLPLGEGTPVSDYDPINGRMKDFDIILSEANSFVPDNGSAGDPTWQIVGRCIHPYNRPVDEPVNDDPRPPFVLHDSVRGERVFCYFETDDPYHWVRTNPGDSFAITAAQKRIDDMRGYVRRLGCKYTG